MSCDRAREIHDRRESDGSFDWDAMNMAYPNLVGEQGRRRHCSERHHSGIPARRRDSARWRLSLASLNGTLATSLSTVARG